MRLDYHSPEYQPLYKDVESLAEKVCALLYWEKGEVFVSQICSSEYLRVEVTGLIGRPSEGTRSFDTFDEKVSRKSRFTTFEITFKTEGEYNWQSQEDDLDIQQ